MAKSKNKQETAEIKAATDETKIQQHTMALPDSVFSPAAKAFVNSNWGGRNDGVPAIVVGMPSNDAKKIEDETNKLIVSASSLPNTPPMATSVVTGEDNRTTTVTYDPHVAPAGGTTRVGDNSSTLVVGTEGVAHGQEPQQVVFNPGEITQDTPVEGVKFDYNDGLRIKVPKGNYSVNIIDLDDCLTVFSGEVSDTMVVTAKKYWVRFRFELYLDGKIIFAHDYDAKGKNVLMRYPTGSVLGDALAWFPYAEEFRKKHQCEVYVLISKQMQEILHRGYPEIHFLVATDEDVQKGIYPAETPQDIYATYTMGVFFPCDDREHQPVDFRVMGLHRNAALILGLNEWEEHPPKLLPSEKEVAQRTVKDPYVCIAVNGSSQAKHWNNARGWINVVKYLKEKGYRVLCIDKEPFHQVGSYMNQIPFGCEDFTGDRPLQERIDLIYHADFFIGLSSGLSWMAWGVGRPVILISGFTLPINEFITPYRVISYHSCNGCWDDTRITFSHSDGEWCPRHKNTERQFECTRNITPEKVCRIIDKCMADNGFNPKGGKE